MAQRLSMGLLLDSLTPSLEKKRGSLSVSIHPTKEVYYFLVISIGGKLIAYSPLLGLLDKVNGYD